MSGTLGAHLEPYMGLYALFKKGKINRGRKAFVAKKGP